jgi:hypothetical protein
MMEPLLTLIPPAIIFVSLKIMQRVVYNWCFLKYFFIWKIYWNNIYIFYFLKYIFNISILK